MLEHRKLPLDTRTGEHLRESLSALEAQNLSLQLLVGELLITNQELRTELAQFGRRNNAYSSVALPVSSQEL
jgi:hypothetical protein